MRQFILSFLLFIPLTAGAALPVEPIPHSLTLPDRYPDTWVFIHDMNFNSILDGKIVVLDVAADTRQYKGSIGAGQFASFTFSPRRNELYVTETFYSRRTRGQATDVLTIYDHRNLAPVDEIILPGDKRLKVVTHKHALQLTDNENMALVSNFTPAASVTVVDLESRKVLSEIQTPACNLVYPTGKRGFSTLCSNGTLSTFNLDKDGAVVSESVTRAFIDIDRDPLFAKTAEVGGITYFPSFLGNVQPVDFRPEKPVLLPAWSLVEGRQKKENWRPGGWQLTGGTGQHLYVLMHQDGTDGSHKDGGSEVWVFDPEKQHRVQRIPLKTWGLSIELTHSSPAYLVVTNANMETDVYDARSGKHIRMLKVATDPFVMHANQP